MRNVLTAVSVACILSFSPAVLMGQSGKGNKEKCDALRKAVAEAQTNYNKAWSAFVTASRQQDLGERMVADAQKALGLNSNAQQGTQHDINTYTAQVEACQKGGPNVACSAERDRLRRAKKKLEDLQAKQKQLELDLAAAEQYLREKDALLAATHARANAAKQALDKAKADLAAANCKIPG